jgi:hypothetical protein
MAADRLEEGASAPARQSAKCWPRPIKSTRLRSLSKAATQSGPSGRPYQVRCGRAYALASNQWLRDVPARHRTHEARDAPRLRGAFATEAIRFKPER